VTTGTSSPGAGDPVTDTVVVHCPAKTNLELSVGAARTEIGNRHPLRTLYCALSLADSVRLTRRPEGSGVSLALQGPHLGGLSVSGPSAYRNHAVRALLAAAETYGKLPDVAISITKRIPVGAGLGGGSADAAGVLLGVNALWQLHEPPATWETIAAELGADMPFCLHGGLAYGSGYGETITLVEDSSEVAQHCRSLGLLGETLIGAYRQQLPTADVYAAFDRLGSCPDDANDLQRASLTLHPRSREAIDLALGAGARHAFVSGSGPSVIACVDGGGVADAVRQAWLEGGAVDWIHQAESPAWPYVE
jgi:4-diphosphocytidyl-2-C-methyl-D-erythritol kinase